MSARRQRKRSRSTREEQSWLTGKTLWIAGVVLALIILAPVLIGFFGGDDEPEVLQGEVQEFPDEGSSHVAPGTEIDYDTDPPTSGTHFDRWAEPQFYREEAPPSGLLVHNLEHGHIVIYYSPERLSDEAAGKLGDLIEQYTGQWDAVLAVPREGQDQELVLTAWTYMLELDEYDEELIDAFVDAYRGRGPENPVR